MDREQLFRDAIRENSRRIFRICSYYFPAPDDRDDAYQETLMRIWENLPSFKGQSQLSTWIYRVTVNSCLSYIRKEKRDSGLFERFGATLETRVAAIPAEDEARDDSKMIFLRHVINDLNMADRTLLSLYMEELSTREMADITGISEANVRVRIHRIKERIKNEWEGKNEK